MAIPEVFRRVCDANGWSLEGNEAQIILDGGRKQTVFLETFGHEGDEMARAYTIVGTADVLTPTRLSSALRLNSGLPYGALAIHEGKLVMADTFLLKDADEDEVKASILFIASSSDRYERLIYGTDEN